MSGPVLLQSGDHLIVCLHTERIEPEVTAIMFDELKDRFPDLEFTFISGVSALAVKRG